MNELGWLDKATNSFGGSNVTKAEEHIKEVFVEAWRKAVTICPRTYFTIRDFSDQPLMANKYQGTGYVMLPDDFYTLYSFRMNGWKKAAEVLFESTDPVAAYQTNIHTRGNFIRPVVIRSIERVADNIDRKEVLFYYSLPPGKNHSITEALYIPLMKPLNEETVISDKLFLPLAYLTGSMVFDLFEKPEIAKVLETKAIELCH